MSQEIKDLNCPIQRTLKVIGGKWKLVILHYLRDCEALRFGQLEKAIGDISPRMLIKELKELEKEKIVNRKQFETIPPTVEYSITEFGKSLLPIIDAMENWGNYYKENQPI